MKTLLLAVLVIAVALGGSSIRATEPSSPPPVTLEQAIAAAQLRSQDRMFALMMAAYFEVQQQNIEQDYERRLHSIAGENQDGLGLVVYSPLKMQKSIPVTLQVILAKERELRMARMARTITDLIELYQNARAEEQKQIGLQVPSAMDIENASKQIQQLLAARKARPHDLRQWADQGIAPHLTAKPSIPNAVPTAEASPAKSLLTDPLALKKQPSPQHQGLLGATLFGLPMLRDPGFLRP